MEKNNKLDVLLNEELLQQVKGAVDKAYTTNLSQKENSDIDLIFRRASDEIRILLTQGLRYQERQVARFVDENLDDIKNRIQQKAKSTRGDALRETNQDLKTLHNKCISIIQDAKGQEEKTSRVSRTVTYIKDGSEQFFDKHSNRERQKYSYAIDQMIMGELRSRFSRGLGVSVNKRTEDANYEISRILRNKLVVGLNNSYEQNTRDIKRNISLNVNSCLDEIMGEYRRLNQRQMDNTEKSIKEKLDLSDKVNSAEEVIKAEIADIEGDNQIKDKDDEKSRPTAKDIAKATEEGYFL